MEVKLLEIRDSATCISAYAFRPNDALDVDAPSRTKVFLLRRCGWSKGNPAIILGKIDTGEAKTDPYAWGSSRTMQVAHIWVEENWESVESGQVIDVEFILGETTEKKQSDAFA